MNWYSLYRQASPPLPITLQDGEWTRGVGITNRYMSEETADKEKERNPKYLGGGWFGLAVEIPNNQVIKYTIRPDEADLARSLIDETELPIVKIYDVEQVQEVPPMWAIRMEKVKPYEEVDPSFNEWSDIESSLCRQLGFCGLAWDITQSNVGWNSDGKPVLFDLGAWM